MGAFCAQTVPKKKTPCAGRSGQGVFFFGTVCAQKAPTLLGREGEERGGSPPYNEENSRHQRQHRQDEALVLKREVEEINEGVQEKPEPEQAEAEAANR